MNLITMVHSIIFKWVSDVNTSHEYYSFGNNTSVGIRVNELRDNIIYKKKQNNKLFDDEFNVNLRFVAC